MANRIVSSTLVFFVNGKKVVDNDVKPETTLLQYLRIKLRLCGTKLGCAEGGCGACTVMVSSYNRTSQTIEHLAVNACLTPVCAVHGRAVTTVEGIGSTKTRLHPVQERMAKSHGSQCGFCTPGIVMSMYTLLRNNTQPTMKNIETCFQGNLCRCTGYRPILEGFKTFTKDFCCGQQLNGAACCLSKDEDTSTELFSPTEFVPYDPSQEPIFPPELKLIDEYDRQYLCFESQRMKWIRPNTLEELVHLKSQYPNARLVIGNTEVGVEVKFKNCYYPVILAPTNIPELYRIDRTEAGITIGASNTLSNLERVLREAVANQPAHRTRTYIAILDILQLFAGMQIRNVAAIAGNIMTASPISDLNPIFLAAGCTLHVASKDGHREIPMDGNFFTGYRRTVVDSNEVVIAIHIPFTDKDEYFYAYKQARRREDDIAIVNAGMRVKFHPETHRVQQMTLAYGGMAPTTVMANRTMAALCERLWDDKMLDDACPLLAEDLPLEPSAPGSMIEFRRTLTTSFFFKFYLNVTQELIKAGTIQKTMSNDMHSATAPLRRASPKSTQLYQIVSPGQRSEDAVGRPIPHLSAAKQATGEAKYCDDIPLFEDELYLSLVTSSMAHAKIVSIDASEALILDGVVAFYCHRDIPQGHNLMGVIFKDEEVFASDVVTCQGQVIGAVVAINQATAQKAVKKVRVQYEPLQPVILTIEDSIKNDTILHNFDRVIQRGDPDKGFLKSDHVLTGEVKIGGQEHFYLETQCTVARPMGEDGEMEIYASTQAPSDVQQEAAHFLGVPSNRIVCKARRLGGGFGGKESHSVMVALPCAFAASRLNRPVRCMLDRDEDMAITGKRHPFFGKYKIGFNDDGRIQALEITFYVNRGNTMDLSHAVMERALMSFDSGYYVPHMRGYGFLCSTNITSNTAFRGFGAPQSMLVTEAAVTDAARYLNKDPAKVRELNLYKDGDISLFKEPMVNCTVRRCWDECLQMSNYRVRQKRVDVFNKENRWKKRGLTIIPTKFGLAFTEKFMNQAGALIHVYRDGSVMLAHGGVEMGQGLHTKMIQVASRALGIPTSLIHTSETTSDKVPNTSPSAASVSSDLNGMAIIEACNTLKARLEPIMANNPKGSWEDWIRQAYFQRISLSATGFYSTPNLTHDFASNTGSPYCYYSFGVGCSEVEIDCLTGDHVVLRTDIVMDVGESLNPAIDIGQIEGAFMQGYGLFVMEELYHTPGGFLLTRGPGTYKIPGFGDIPQEFNVALLKGSKNLRAVYSSKAIGEPPLFLGAAAFYAIKDAVDKARHAEGLGGLLQMNTPATAERIRMACTDRFTRQFPPADPKSFTPWSIPF